jgi:hypothetical protein
MSMKRYKSSVMKSKFLPWALRRFFFYFVKQYPNKNITLFLAVTFVQIVQEPGYRSRYSGWLRAGWQRGQSSYPGRVKNFIFSTSFRPALGLTQSPIQWVLVAFYPEVKRPGREANHSPLTNANVRKAYIYVYIHSLTRLHDVVLN